MQQIFKHEHNQSTYTNFVIQLYVQQQKGCQFYSINNFWKQSGIRFDMTHFQLLGAIVTGSLELDYTWWNFYWKKNI